MLIVVATYRGTFEVKEFPDSVSDESLNSQFASNWFKSSSHTDKEAIKEAEESGLRYTEPDEEDQRYCERMRDAGLIPLRKKNGRVYRF